MEGHLPRVFHDELSGVYVTNQRLGVLISITRLLLGVWRSLYDLMWYIETQGVLNLVDPLFTRGKRLTMTEFGIALVMMYQIMSLSI